MLSTVPGKFFNETGNAFYIFISLIKYLFCLWVVMHNLCFSYVHIC